MSGIVIWVAATALGTWSFYHGDYYLAYTNALTALLGLAIYLDTQYN